MSSRFAQCLFLLLLLTLSTSADVNNTLTAYEVLEEYDFPIGLLPQGVTGYELDSSTGKFSAYLNSSCTFTIDSYKLKYKTTPSQASLPPTRSTSSAESASRCSSSGSTSLRSFATTMSSNSPSESPLPISPSMASVSARSVAVDLIATTSVKEE